jgi:pilus assembly protein Flp/PilA
MRKLVARLVRDTRGQGMTEYIIIVALIAIASIGVVSLFGNDIQRLYAGATNALAGEQKVDPKTQKASARHVKQRTLKSFAADTRGAK